MNNVTVEESILVQAPVEKVFDFTQDWSRRADWDKAVVSAEPVDGSAERAFRVRGQGGLRFLARYKLFRRPEATSLSMEQTFSLMIQGGGGSWRYEPMDGGTRWTQVNTLQLGGGLFGWLLAPVIKAKLSESTRAPRRFWRRADSAMDPARGASATSTAAPRETAPSLIQPMISRVVPPRESYTMRMRFMLLPCSRSNVDHSP